MIKCVKILFLFFSLLIISCDEKEDLPADTPNPIIYGCINSGACNYDAEANADNGSCEFNLFCYDSDGDGFGYGDSTQICLDEIPDGWVVDCNDPADDCIGSKDDCGECNGENQSKDCAGVCFGSNVLDRHDTCCSASNIQMLRPMDPDGSDSEVCLPELFKWALTMTARIGEYENNIFIPSSDSASFVIGTHYLSTDGLDILDDISYNDIVKPPTIENSLSIYTSHPEWEYFAGNDFIQEYKFHDLDKLSFNDFPDTGIEWIGNITYGTNFGTKFIKLTFTLNSNQIEMMGSRIELSFNDEVLVYSADCEDELRFSSDSADQCNIVNESFEYIFPITFQPGYEVPFSILIGDTYLY